MKCGNCGNELSGDASFCKVCGTKIFSQNYSNQNQQSSNYQGQNTYNDVSNEKEWKKCPVCGKIIKAESEFCSGCGASLEVDIENNYYNEQGYNNEINTDKVVAKKKKDKGLIALIIILIIVLLGSVSTAIYFMIDNKAIVEKVETDDDEIDEDEENEKIKEDDKKVDIANLKILVSDTDDTLYIRKSPRHDSGVVAEIENKTTMFYFGEKEKGRGDDGEIYDWYKVKTEDGDSGWVLSELVRVKSGDDSDDDDSDMPNQVVVFVKNTSLPINVKMSPEDNSTSVVKIDDEQDIYFFGKAKKGIGSDGEMHDWYNVKTEDGYAGWVRSDFVKVKDSSIGKEKEKTSKYTPYKANITWEEANKNALSMGGNLICINSLEEFNKACSIAEQNGFTVFWVGMKRTTDDWNNSYWQDGSKMTYEKWLQGEPTYSNTDGSPENYLLVFKVNNKKGNGWYFNDVENDVTKYYSGKIGYIVEFEE